VLRLLPPVCRDCGKGGRKAALSRYLEFHLCEACIVRRERALRENPGVRRTRKPRRLEPQSPPVEAPGGGGKTRRKAPRKRDEP
jgi:hypothetical protein